MSTVKSIMMIRLIIFLLEHSEYNNDYYHVCTLYFIPSFLLTMVSRSFTYRLELERYNITGIAEFAAEMKEKELGMPKVSLQFELSTSGITRLVKAEAAVEETYMVMEDEEVEDEDAEEEEEEEAAEEEKKEETKEEETKDEEKKEGDDEEKKDEETKDEKATDEDKNATEEEKKPKKKKKKTKTIQVEKVRSIMFTIAYSTT